MANMPRGNGKHAKDAIGSKTGLAAFIKPAGSESLSEANYYVDWSEIQPTLLTGAVIAAVKQGGALLLGCSRDKKSYSVKVYIGGEGTPYYFPCTPNGVEALEEFLYGIIQSEAYSG